MRVQCPDCGIAYEVPDPLLASRKKLRCARCGAEWIPGEAAPTPAENIPDAPAQVVSATPLSGFVEEPAPPVAARARLEQTEREPLSAMERLARPVEPPRRSPWTGIAWVVSLLLLGALAWGAVTWRADVMHAWPPSTRAYAALGLTPPSK